MVLPVKHTQSRVKDAYNFGLSECNRVNDLENK